MMTFESKYPCPKCASMRTELRDFPEREGLPAILLKLLRVFSRRGQGFAQGQKILVCRDCGNKSLISIM